MSCGVGHRLNSDPVLLWLWCRLVATALIQALAWEPPYATGEALKRKEKKKKNLLSGVLVMAQRKRIRLGTMRLWVQSLFLLIGLRIRCFCELWCRLQMWLGSEVAVAVVWAGGYRSN